MRWLGYAAGGALVVLGFVGLLMDARWTDPVGWATWFGGILVLHDAVLVPIVLVTGLVVRNLTLRAGLIVAGLVTLAVLPTVLAIGRKADNPSILPLDYGRNLVLVLGTIAVVMIIPRLRTRTVLLGTAAGLAGGLIVGSLMAFHGMLSAEGGLPAQWALFLTHAAILGAVLGAIVGERAYDLANAFALGLLVGLLTWVGWQLTLRPLLSGEMPTWTIMSADEHFRALVGDVLLGGITGVLLYGALTRSGRPATTQATETAAPRVVIVGGGFGGLSAARLLDRLIARGLRADVTLISDSNFLLFTPMLAGVAASELEARHVSAPVRAALSQVAFLHATVESVDTRRRTVRLDGGRSVPYDQLVLAVGAVSHFYALPGMAEHAFPLKTIGDATRLRDHVLGALESADLEADVARRRELLTFVVAGGGFAGTELVAELFDLVHGVLHHYPGVRTDEPRFVLVHAGERILPELSDELASYAGQKLDRRGIEIRLKTEVAAATAESVRLGDGEEISTRTMAWTAGNRPHPLISTVPGERGRGGALAVDPCLRVPGLNGVWAIGDCAHIPDPLGDGRPYPPTAQHAVREGRAVGENVAAVIAGRQPAEFRFRGLGTLVALGHRTAVGEIRGLRLSGFVAWAMWRAVYLAKLPGLEKKLRVLLDWSLDLAFPRDIARGGRS